jgi:hypothetical protein
VISTGLLKDEHKDNNEDYYSFTLSEDEKTLAVVNSNFTKITIFDQKS